MFTETKEVAASIVPVVGQIMKTDLVRAVRTIWLQFRVRATLTLAGGPATAILNQGSILSIFDFAGTDENGKRYIEADPRMLAIYSQMCTNANLDFGRVRQTSLVNGAYDLEESFWVPFTSNLLAAGPLDTVFLERNTQRTLSAFIRQISASAANLIVQTPGTAVLSNVSVDVVQRYDRERQKRTLLEPTIRQMDFPVTSTSSAFIAKIETTDFLLGLVVAQVTTGAGFVTDVVNSLALRADGIDFYGPTLLPYEDLQADSQMEFAGDVSTGGTLPIWFRKSGRLSNALNPNTVANLRLVMDVQPSVTVGAGDSFVRVLLIEGQKVPGLTPDTIDFTI